MINEHSPYHKKVEQNMTQREKNCSLWHQQVFQEQQKFPYRLKGMQEVGIFVEILNFAVLWFLVFGF